MTGRDRCHARGSALVMALFMLVLLTGMGTALLFLGQHESRMSRTDVRAKQAFFLAEAGIEDARQTLYAANVDDEFDDELLTAAGANGVLDFDPLALRAQYDEHGAVIGFEGYGDDVPLRSLAKLVSPDGPGWYAAFLTNDPLEGRSTTTDGNRRLLLTGVGAGAGKSIEVVHAIVESVRVLPPVPPAALTLLGREPAYFDNGTSRAQEHTGDDCGVPDGAYAPVVGTVSAESKANVQDDVNRPENFEAGSFTGLDTIADLTDLSDPIVDAAGHGMIDPLWTDCLQLRDLVDKLAASASYYCNSDVESCDFSTGGPYPVVVIDGDLANTPSGHYTGILLVTGELIYRGSTAWDGVVMAIGEGRVIRSGGGGGNPSGGMVVANIDPTPDGPAADRSDWCTSGDAGFAQSYYDTSGGGNATVEWCTDNINAANVSTSYSVVDFRQR